MCIRRNRLNLRVIRKRTGILGIVLAFCLLALIASWFIAGNAAVTDASSDSFFFAKKSTNVKPETSTATNNSSSVKVENGIPKLSVNGKIINNIFGLYVYSTGVDATTNDYIKKMKTVIDKTSALKIPIMSFDILWSDFDKSTEVPSDATLAAERFNTKSLDAILDYAASKNIYVILQLLVHDHSGLPKWWKEYKDNKDGYQMINESSQDHITFNQKQTPVASFNSSTHRELLTALIKKLVLKYKNHAAIVGWQINLGPTGENGYGPNYLEVMFNPDIKNLNVDFSSVMADYSKKALNNFVSWLKIRYSNDITKLNSKWGKTYRTFDEAIFLANVKDTLYPVFDSQINPYLLGDKRPSMLDWQYFRYETLLNEWKFLSKTVKELDPGKLVAGNTSWAPTSTVDIPNMNLTAISVYEDSLIDIDRWAGSITVKDDLQGKGIRDTSLVDYNNYVKFSAGYKIVRIYHFDYWVRNPTEKITFARAREARDAMKKAGGYFWFLTALEGTEHRYPSWPWGEIEALVKDSSTNELQTITIGEPKVRLMHNVDSYMRHYSYENRTIATNNIFRSISRSFYYTGQDNEYGFISPNSSFDPAKTKLIIAVNNFELTDSLTNKMKSYVNEGGNLLLVGSNGVFNSENRADYAKLKILAPGLSATSLRKLLNWNLSNKIPFIFISKNKTEFAEIDINGKSDSNYSQLKALIATALNIKTGGKLTFSYGDSTNQASCDCNVDGIVDAFEASLCADGGGSCPPTTPSPNLINRPALNEGIYVPKRESLR